MIRSNLRLLLPTLGIVLSASAAPVLVTESGRDFTIQAADYGLELNKSFGTFRRLWDTRGGDYSLAIGPATPPGFSLVLPALPFQVWDNQLRYGSTQPAILRIYPAIADPDAAIQSPAIVWQQPVATAALQPGHQAVFTSPHHDQLAYRFAPDAITVNVTGPRGPYEIILCLPMPDGAGHIHTDGDAVHWLPFLSAAETETATFRVFHPQRRQTFALDLGPTKRRVTYEMYGRGTLPERALISYLGLRFTLPAGDSFTIRFPDAGGAQLASQSILALHGHSAGTPTTAARGWWQARQLRLPRNQPLLLDPAGGDPLTNTPLIACAAEISGGDYDFIWKQTEPTHVLPGHVPFPVDDFWQPVPLQRAGNQLRIDLSALPAGLYKVRVADTNDTLTGALYVELDPPPAGVALFAQDQRRVFYRGEIIELTCLPRGEAAGKQADVTLTDVGGKTLAHTRQLLRSTQTFHLDTASLPPGRYVVTAGSAASRFAFEIVAGERAAAFGIVDNALGAAPFQFDLTTSSFGGIKAAPYRQDFARSLRELRVNAMRRTLAAGIPFADQRALGAFLAGSTGNVAPENFPAHSLLYPWFDSLAREQIGYWQGVQSRGLSFSKAILIEESVGGFAQRLAISAQQLRRFPNYCGGIVDVDTASASGLSNYSGVPDADRAAYNALVQQRLDAVPAADRYRYLCELFPRTNARYQELLKRIDPHLLQTSNTEYHHGAVNTGAYPPTLYAGLDFTAIEAWGDGRFYPLQNAFWTDLAVAARTNDAPVWIESQAFPDCVADQLEHNWWEVVGCGGDGVGYAANIFGLNMYGVQSHVADTLRDRAAILGRLMERFGPLFRSLRKQRDVALLFSFQQGARVEAYGYSGHISNPLYGAYYVLSRLQTPPDIVYEESIRAGKLRDYKALVLCGQTAPLPADVRQRIAEFQAAGGVVIGDGATTLDLPGMKRLQAKHEFPQDAPSIYYLDDLFTRARDEWRAALDPIAPRPFWTPREAALLYPFADGDDRYLIALNQWRLPTDLMSDLKSLDFHRWLPHREKLYLRDSSRHVFDLLTQREVKVQRDKQGRFIELDFTRGNFRVFAFRGGGKVAQTSSLPYRGFPIRSRPAPATPSRLEVGDTAGWKPALPGQTLRAADDVLVYDEHAYAARLTQGAAITILLDPRQAHRQAVAEKLRQLFAARGVTCDIWPTPPTVSEPVAWTYTEAERALKARVNAGEVIGERFWRGGRYDQSWELTSGEHIARQIVLLGNPQENRWLAALHDAHVLRREWSPGFPGAGKALLEYVWAFFSPDHDAIVLLGEDDAGLTKAAERLFAPMASGPDRLSQARARFEASLGFGGPPTQPALEQTDDLFATLGRPVRTLAVSPNGKFVACTLEAHGYNTFLLDHRGRLLWKQRLGAGDYPGIGAVNDQGTVAAVTAAGTEVFDSAGKRRRRLDGWRVFWLSPDAAEFLAATDKDIARGRLDDGAMRWSFPHQAAGAEFRASADGALVVGPVWHPMTDPNGGAPRQASGAFLFAVNGATGKEIWRQPGFYASSLAFSPNGRWLAAAKKRYYQFNPQDQSWGEHDSMLTLLNAAGATVLEERADVQLRPVAVPDSGAWVVGVPYVATPFALLARPGQPLQKIAVNGEFVTDAAVSGEGFVLATVDGWLAGYNAAGNRQWTRHLGRQSRVWRGGDGWWAGTFRGDLLRVDANGWPGRAIDLVAQTELADPQAFFATATRAALTPPCALPIEPPVPLNPALPSLSATVYFPQAGEYTFEMDCRGWLAENQQPPLMQLWIDSTLAKTDHPPSEPRVPGPQSLPTSWVQQEWRVTVPAGNHLVRLAFAVNPAAAQLDPAKQGVLWVRGWRIK